MNRIEIARKLSDERKKRKITYRELEEKTGISYQSIQRTLNGNNFTIDQLLKISNAIGLDVIVR